MPGDNQGSPLGEVRSQGTAFNIGYPLGEVRSQGTAFNLGSPVNLG